MTVTVPYITVDVFTATPFGGNPLAVIPDARGLSDADMQQIAREFNYSELTFVLPARDPENTAHVRIFTPTCEVPFAGHPNVGTAFVLGQERHVFGQSVEKIIRFEESAGLIDVRLVRDADRVIGAEIKTPRALTLDHSIDPSVIADCASIDIGEIVTVHHNPVMASVGLPFAIAEVSSLEVLANARPNLSAFTNADHRYPHRDIQFSLFLYIRISDVPFKVRARMFAPLDNVPEDPATGSASAALAAYLVSLRSETELQTTIVVEQGVEMGRPSLIELDVHKADNIVTEVAIRGQCVSMMRGVLQLRKAY